MRVLTLVGLMGAGKSSVGTLLARQLNWRFADLDTVIESRKGLRVAALFDNFGESKFREIEGAILRELLTGSDLVLATGGGAPCGPGAMDAILASGAAVWLHGELMQLAERACAQGGRPLLEGLSPQEACGVLREQLRVREAAYSRAGLRVDVDGRNPEALATSIHRTLFGEEAGRV